MTLALVDPTDRGAWAITAFHNTLIDQAPAAPGSPAPKEHE
jgi:hypothetical protein